MMVASVASATQRINRPVGRELEKWVCLEVGSVQEISDLAGVIDDESRQHHSIPCSADWVWSDVAHVSVERFTTRQREEYTTQ